jgi:hypothetical protein
MNQYRTSGARTAFAAPLGIVPAKYRFKIALILLHIFGTRGVVYQPLTLFGKDCARIGWQASIRAETMRILAGNGELAWL